MKTDLCKNPKCTNIACLRESVSYYGYCCHDCAIDSSYGTAISRNSPSAPMVKLSELGLLKGRMLDYGCGKGFDAQYYKMDKYDPYYFPRIPVKSYDTITCNYVLNVIRFEDERQSIIRAILSLLAPNGNAYVSVRRDIKHDHHTSKGYQCNVVLNNFVVYELKNRYCIYRISN